MSLKESRAQYSTPIQWFPSNPAWNNYIRIWKVVPLGKYFMNSMIVAIFTVVVCIPLASLAGFSLSKFRFHGRQFFGIVILCTQFLPGALLLIPLYIIYNNIQRWFGIPVIDTYHGLFITYATFGIPFSVWMLRSYFDSISYELMEAAKVEGCNTLQAFVRIMVPLSSPGIAATAMYVFILGWNEVLFASVMTGAKVRTYSLGLRDFEQQTSAEYGLLMAASIVLVIPIVGLFLYFQKYIVSGLTGGGVKE
jgi:multiple sugar transport system permease protein